MAGSRAERVEIARKPDAQGICVQLVQRQGVRGHRGHRRGPTVVDASPVEVHHDRLRGEGTSGIKNGRDQSGMRARARGDPPSRRPWRPGRRGRSGGCQECRGSVRRRRRASGAGGEEQGCAADGRRVRWVAPRKEALAEGRHGRSRRTDHSKGAKMEARASEHWLTRPGALPTTRIRCSERRAQRRSTIWRGESRESNGSSSTPAHGWMCEQGMATEVDAAQRKAALWSASSWAAASCAALPRDDARLMGPPAFSTAARRPAAALGRSSVRPGAGAGIDTSS